MRKFNISVLASSVLLVAAGSATAATQGTLDVTSTGTSVVTIIKENAVQISNVGDIDLGTQATLAADAVASDDVCVFSSTSAYNLTVTSANGAFELQNGAEAIPYGLSWDAAPVAQGVAITGLTGDNVSLNCSGGTNATFEVTVASADFNGANPGTYTDTLTLLVQPE